jgi:predicted lipoprotein with Yx(FWY)xxD motif
MLRWVRSVAYTLVVSLVFFTFAVATAQGGLATAFSEDWGEILVDAEGRSLYLYTLDADDGFACVDACINNRIPLLVPSLEALHGGAEIDMALVSLRQRAEGSYQVVYGDWPVYRSQRDAAAGTTRGQAVGSQFYLLNVDAPDIREIAGGMLDALISSNPPEDRAAACGALRDALQEAKSARGG